MQRAISAGVLCASLWSAAAAWAQPTISQINPPFIPANSSAVTLRIIGAGLAGTSASPCSSPANTVTWNGLGLTITSASATEVDATVPANLLTTPGAYVV